MKANAILRHRNKRATDHAMPGFAIRKACKMLEDIRKIYELKRPAPKFAKGTEIVGESSEEIIVNGSEVIRPGEKKTFIFSERTAKLVEQILDSKKMITPLSQVPKSPLKLSSDFAFDNMTKNDAELIARSLSYGTPKTE